MADVRFGPDYVCLALNSGRKWVREFESGFDPKRTLRIMLGEAIIPLSQHSDHQLGSAGIGGVVVEGRKPAFRPITAFTLV